MILLFTPMSSTTVLLLVVLTKYMYVIDTRLKISEAWKSKRYFIWAYSVFFLSKYIVFICVVCCSCLDTLSNLFSWCWCIVDWLYSWNVMGVLQLTVPVLTYYVWYNVLKNSLLYILSTTTSTCPTINFLNALVLASTAVILHNSAIIIDTIIQIHQFF
jgi:hypothetical protein